METSTVFSGGIGTISLFLFGQVEMGSSPIDLPLAEVESKREKRCLGALLAMPASASELHSTVQQQAGPGQSSFRNYLIC